MLLIIIFFFAGWALAGMLLASLPANKKDQRGLVDFCWDVAWLPILCVEDLIKTIGFWAPLLVLAVLYFIFSQDDTDPNIGWD